MWDVESSTLPYLAYRKNNNRVVVKLDAWRAVKQIWVNGMEIPIEDIDSIDDAYSRYKSLTEEL